MKATFFLADLTFTLQLKNWQKMGKQSLDEPKRQTRQFHPNDFYSLEKLSPMFTGAKINTIIDETIEQVLNWTQLAHEHDVPKSLREAVEANLSLKI